MKRMLALAAAACTLVVPAIASGAVAQGLYDGHLDGAPESPVALKFNLVQNPDSTDYYVRAFAVHELQVECDDGVVATLDHAKLKGHVPIGSGNNFRVTDDNRKTVYKVSGHIGVNKAFGKFRLTGKIEGTDGVTRQCDSGSLGWVARP